MKPRLLDGCGRAIDYLRISVTDRCNLRCVYCTPAEGIHLWPSQEILKFEEIETVAKAALALGVDKFRITGGEPLVRRGIVGLVERLSALEGLADLSMTTNGTFLAAQAKRLARAGLKRVNISLDSLDPDAYLRLTRGGDIRAVLEGMEAALEAGLDPVKLNVVMVPPSDQGQEGWVERQVDGFARLTQERRLHVRFIELMPMGPRPLRSFVPADKIRHHLSGLGPLTPVAGPYGNGPAEYFRLPGAKGTLGFISAISRCYCATCNRLRLTATGYLRLCLWSGDGVDLKSLIRSRQGVEGLKEAMVKAVCSKPASYPANLLSPDLGTMCQVGG